MELQELIYRGRFIFAGAPERLRVFSLVNGRNSTKAIVRKVKRSFNNVLRDLQKLRDVGLIEPKRDKEGNPSKAEGSVTYEKVPLARQIPARYFQDSRATAKHLIGTQPRSPIGVDRAPRAKPLPIPSETEILDVCRQGEDQLHEFKEPGIETRKITKEIAAFLHTPQGGVVFYGVRDDGTIAGTDLSRQKLDQQVHNSVRNTVSPSPNIQIRSVDVMGAEVIIIVVPPWNRREVYFYEGRVYIRRGTNVFEAKPEEIKRLHDGKFIV